MKHKNSGEMRAWSVRASLMLACQCPVREACSDDVGQLVGCDLGCQAILETGIPQSRTLPTEGRPMIVNGNHSLEEAASCICWCQLTGSSASISCIWNCAVVKDRVDAASQMAVSRSWKWLHSSFLHRDGAADRTCRAATVNLFGVKRCGSANHPMLTPCWLRPVWTASLLRGGMRNLYD